MCTFVKNYFFVSEVLSNIQALLKQLTAAATPIRMVFSAPSSKNYAPKITLKSYLSDEDQLRYQAVEHWPTQDLTHSLDTVGLMEKVLLWSSEYYGQTQIYTTQHNYSILRSKKGKISLLKTKAQKKIDHDRHNHSKNYLIPSHASFLKAIGLASSNGLIFAPAQKKYRQINKFVEIISHHVQIQAKSQFKVADMGCGKAYLSFALYHYFRNELGKDIYVEGYDIRPELTEINQKHAQDLGYPTLEFRTGDIGQVTLGVLDMIIALHACDIATDMAIFQGIRSEAKYIVVSPCCHKQVRKAMGTKDYIAQHGILQERLAELVTDTMRMLLLEHMGYRCKIMEFVPIEESGKNLLIIATKTSPNPNALPSYFDLKSKYEISFHYLGKLLGIEPLDQLQPL